MPQKPKLSIEEKIDIVGRCIKGEWGIREAERIVGVSNATIRRWILSYHKSGTGYTAQR